QKDLIKKYGEEKGLSLHRHFAGAFPLSYQELFTAESGVDYIHLLQQIISTKKMKIDLVQGHDRLHFKIFNPGLPLPLSDILPMIEHMGLRVIAELPHELKVQRFDQPIWLHDFHVELDLPPGV